jgi:hypothetical protein
VLSTIPVYRQCVNLLCYHASKTAHSHNRHGTPFSAYGVIDQISDQNQSVTSDSLTKSIVLKIILMFKILTK